MPKSGPPVEVTHEPTLLVAARRQTIDRTALSEFFDAAYAELVETLAAADVRIVGAPIAWYFRVPDDTVDVAAAFPVADAAPRPLGQDVAEPDVPPMEILTLPGGRCLVTEHVGPYEGMGSSWDRLVERWNADHGAVGRGDFWEVYEREESREPDPGRWRTRLVLPLG
jgi:effector-binding domain-containing protein